MASQAGCTWFCFFRRCAQRTVKKLCSNQIDCEILNKNSPFVLNSYVIASGTVSRNDIMMEFTKMLDLSRIISLAHKWNIKLKTNLHTKIWLFLNGRLCSVGKLFGLVANGLPLTSMVFPRFCCRLLSIMIFLQISLNVFAIVRAGISHRKTWHICLRVVRSLATYAKSLKKTKKTYTG